ncbi:MAG: hypothetical protein M9888_06630 [Chitinophagales bacterium]|nr:hypothetical protein [Chitinophagales bacterium]
MKKKIMLMCCLLLSIATHAQAELIDSIALENRITDIEEAIKENRNFKVSGYIQTQFQFGEQFSALKVGASNDSKSKNISRVGIRRGRLKFTYEKGIVAGVFQMDMTEKGIGVKDAYLNIKDPWLKSISLKAGVFDRPFGYEISYSSSQREAPERSTIFQTLFPEERDLGLMLTLQAPKTSIWSMLKLEAGIFAGNGIKMETDNRKDFIGHLSLNHTIKDFLKIGGGISYYNGGVYQGSKNIYTMQGNSFVLNNDSTNIGKYAKREYIGFDMQINAITKVGTTKLVAEYLMGIQPGTNKDSKSPNASTLPTSDTYIRKFNGGYIMLTQDFGKAPLTGVLKYDWYNPNKNVSKDNIGLNNTNKGDIDNHTIGVGLLWKATSSIRVIAFYDIVRNEITKNIADYSQNRKDNVFTLRFQYKF